MNFRASGPTSHSGPEIQLTLPEQWGPSSVLHTSGIRELTASGGGWHHLWEPLCSRRLPFARAPLCLSDPGSQN